MQNKNSHFTKQKLLQYLSKKSGITKKNVDLIFKELLNAIREHMQEGGPEKFILPGIFKITTKNVPAQEEKTGINPFTKEKMTFKAKAATKKIKIKALKDLKDIVK